MTPIKDPSESIVIEFDFVEELAAIDSAVTAIAIHGSGVDPDVASMLDGALQISGTSVLQRVRAGVPGVDYTLRCVATRGADVIVRADNMPVRSAPFI